MLEIMLGIAAWALLEEEEEQAEPTDSPEATSAPRKGADARRSAAT
jgi:hypothetical protein